MRVGGHKERETILYSEEISTFFSFKFGKTGFYSQVYRTEANREPYQRHCTVFPKGQSLQIPFFLSSFLYSQSILMGSGINKTKTSTCLIILTLYIKTLKKNTQLLFIPVEESLINDLLEKFWLDLLRSYRLPTEV